MLYQTFPRDLVLKICKDKSPANFLVGFVSKMQHIHVSCCIFQDLEVLRAHLSSDFFFVIVKLVTNVLDCLPLWKYLGTGWKSYFIPWMSPYILLSGERKYPLLNSHAPKLYRECPTFAKFPGLSDSR